MEVDVDKGGGEGGCGKSGGGGCGKSSGGGGGKGKGHHGFTQVNSSGAVSS